MNALHVLNSNDFFLDVFRRAWKKGGFGVPDGI